MIVVNTHIWVWWVHGDSSLSSSTHSLLDSSEQTDIGVMCDFMLGGRQTRRAWASHFAVSGVRLTSAGARVSRSSPC